MRLALPALLLACTACTMVRPSTDVIAQPQENWRVVATDSDRARLRDWRQAFVSALDAARASGHGGEIASAGALLDPDSALGGAIPNGLYRCRMIKLGAKSAGMLDYVAYPPFACRIQKHGALQAFTKLTGSQRQVGLIFPGDQLHQIFLGTVMLSDEVRAMQYGVDEDRDVAGFVERIGPNRWRLLMPKPHFESQIDVMELVPASLPGG
jgi:hypothetical protein